MDGTHSDITQATEAGSPPGRGRRAADATRQPAGPLEEALLLNRLAAELVSSEDLVALGECLSRGLNVIGPVTDVATYLRSPEGSFRSIVGTRPDVIVSPSLDQAFRRETLVMGQGLEAGIEPRIEAARRGPLSAGTGIAFGLCARSELVGFVHLTTPAFEAFEDRRPFLRRLAGMFGSIAANAVRYEEMRLLHTSTLVGLESALNARDNYSLFHPARTSTYLALLAEESGWDERSQQLMVEACMLHDIGTMGINERVLMKRGPLDAEEWAQVREHPVIAADIIGPLFPEELVSGVRHHHERYDGTGYPDGLAGERIPLFARALAVVDAYDAMSMHRPYRPALGHTECLAELRRGRGTQFDPALTDAFLEVLARLHERRLFALAVAGEAAACIDPEAHRTFTEAADQETRAYREMAARVRAVRDAHPPVRFITTQAWSGRRVVFVLDAEEEGSPAKSDIGDSSAMHEEIERVLMGQEPDINIVVADDFGVWVSASVPLVSRDGAVVAAVAVDLPALERSAAPRLTEGSAPVVRTATTRLGRAEVDSITDPLTGLYNRRYISARLAEEVVRAQGDGVPLSVLFCDLDGFKAFNDEHGHSAGDRALNRVARVIERCVRRIDLVGRYGGEEILVVLPGSDGEDACEVAERVRAAVAEDTELPEGSRLTVSVGVASFPTDAEGTQELIDRADWAMYRAKRDGRDRVVSFSC